MLALCPYQMLVLVWFLFQKQIAQLQFLSWDSREAFPQGFIFHHSKFTNKDLSKMWINHIMVCFHSGGERFHSHYRAWCLHVRAAGSQVTGRLCDVVHESVVLLLRQFLADSVHLGSKNKDSLVANW